jgi:hypothetical protein
VKLASLSALVAALLVGISGAARADDSLVLRGYGTPVVDGILAAGEWNAAGHYDFQATRAPAHGGGTVPATLYVMNDSTNLYLALSVAVPSVGYGGFSAAFHAPGENPFAEGNDILTLWNSTFEDFHYHQTSPNSWDWLADVADGGTNDGTGLMQESGGVTTFELSHPLNSADDRHDFSLTIPEHVTFFADVEDCIDSCAGTFMPASGFGQIVVVSGTHVPPETRITSGPRDGAQVRDERTFEFTGTDDVAPLDELRFECAIDGEEWSDCESPLGGVVADGWHTLQVRALDDMLNADPTPAQRRWRIDTRPPSKPKVTRRGTMLRFSAQDRGTPSNRIRFRCAVDARRLHACSSRLRVPARGHVVRVGAVDPAGNESGVKMVRFAH